jgi:hypothetical protein
MGALLTASGTPSISNDTLMLTVTGIQPTTPGVYFYGFMPAGGTEDGLPFGNGLLCVDNPTRIVKQTGGGTIPLPSSPPLSVLLGLQPGDTTYFQFWYRNPNGPCNGNSNTTNAIRATWGL